MTVYVGMDVHRKRSQVAIVDDAGVPQHNRNLANDPAKLVPVLGALPPGTPVAFEAAYGWSWLVDLLEELELEPHLVHPSRCKAIASARLKNDKVDAATLGGPGWPTLPCRQLHGRSSRTAVGCWTPSPPPSPGWKARSPPWPSPTHGSRRFRSCPVSASSPR
jgi:hypothetical protein